MHLKYVAGILWTLGCVWDTHRDYLKCITHIRSLQHRNNHNFLFDNVILPVWYSKACILKQQFCLTVLFFLIRQKNHIPVTCQYIVHEKFILPIIHSCFMMDVIVCPYALSMLVWLITVSKRGPDQQTSVRRKWCPDRNYLYKFHKYDQREISVSERVDVCGISGRNLYYAMILMLPQPPIHEWILQVRLSPPTQIMILGLYSLRRRRLINVGIPIINLSRQTVLG